jgi:hypothetical protein
MTDSILNSALSGLLPFLRHHSARALADALLERLSTHLVTELHFIRTGKNIDGLGEYTSAQTFRDRFVSMNYNAILVSKIIPPKERKKE